MKNIFTTSVRPLIRKLGIDIVKYKNSEPEKKRLYPTDFSEEVIEICNIVKPFTMTSEERIFTLINAVEYIVKNNIEGAIVESGVWKGGSIMVSALTLKRMNDVSRDIYLYDTFSGMSAPTESDIAFDGMPAQVEFDKTKISEDVSDWCFSPLEEVRENVFRTGYPREKFHFVKGKVQDTIPENLPSKIALLRLDTDWYESTKHELTHFYPRLQKDGILILDDYGYWNGVKKAVDEYFDENNIHILLNRIDYCGRLAIKS